MFSAILADDSLAELCAKLVAGAHVTVQGVSGSSTSLVAAAVQRRLERPLLLVTPHLGASTTEAQVNVALQVAEQMADYLLTGAVTNALNMPSVSAEDAPKLQPYIVMSNSTHLEGLCEMMFL